METHTGEAPVDQRISVAIEARDPISVAGVVSQLRHRPEIIITERNAETAPQVVVVVADIADEEALITLRHIQRTTSCRTLLVTSGIDEQKLLSAVECGIGGVIRRADATPERLVKVIARVAQGDGHLPPDLLGRLLDEVGRLQNQVLIPRGLHFTGLTERETDVLRLVAEGCDTAEISAKLGYSERTIKNDVQTVMARLHLRNRAHAVAHAMRHGLI
ncbi:helix-turn-helix transcriptional regulator [Streptomyces niveus]|uniref:helix-turn-helix transcriptional regulator n=1 Tax=Streptomyces niveus TaxID=193462 RepID=UPI001F37170A|nr:response regulator transcription factor [Streptomyces niveus]